MRLRLWNVLRYVVVLALNVIDYTFCVKITNINVPNVADVRGIVTLSCTFSMGKDKLHSVKFYKDGREFFRYLPLMDIRLFTVPGVNIIKRPEDSCNRRVCTISLGDLNSSSSGIYRCEVSGDAPTFNVAYESRNMTVYALPHREPVISGLGRHYEIGDYVFANCTSDLSFPPSTLVWYINDQKAIQEVFPQRDIKVEESNGFSKYIRNLNIRFLIEKERFKDSGPRIHLKCVAKIREVPEATKETEAAIFVPSLEKFRNQMPLNFLSSGFSRDVPSKVLLLVLLISLTRWPHS